MTDNHLEDFFGIDPHDPEIKNKESIKETLGKQVRRWSSLRLLPKVLSFRERYLILAFVLVIIGSLIAIPFSAYSHFTKPMPDFGGSFSEGEVGQPRLINPLLATSDADRDLVSLIYSGLLKYNPSGQLVPDLAKSYEISSDGLNYTLYLNDQAKWQDGMPVTADDVVYTVTTAQNPDYSSVQRINWQGVTVQKVDDETVLFKLKTPYAQFLNNLTLGILPKHIWQNIQPINFSLSEYNLKPIGSGPYDFEKFQKDSLGQVQEYDLSSYKNYVGGQPYIDSITLKFYQSEGDMIAGYNHNEIQNLAYVSPENLNKLNFKQRLNIEKIKLPRYFGVFFNQTQNQNLADKNVRLALNYATDKKAIIDGVLSGDGTPVYSPLIENVLDVSPSITKYEFDVDHAKQILSADGWTAGSDGVLTKKNTKLSLTITTSTFPELAEAANILKNQWSAIGVDVTINALSTPELQQAIRDRSYDALLFGEILNLDPDPFSLWHSSQRQDPGLNLALYDNSTADSLLETARQTLDPTARLSKYNDFQNLVINDAPAVFLYNPDYIYPQNRSIKGFDDTVIAAPSNRFVGIEKWYINTKRVWRNSNGN
ncbi:MAG TPA: ABC transporter substrate-binding protein [Candidatus Paceibacterota bacterium]|nr:ABC transporter substrate-binding protein [Candidatus Paceibacterota bacterium]